MSIPQESLPSEGTLPRPYEDVRQWLDLVESMGELKRVNGADWNLEIGTMAELIYRERSGTIPASCSIASRATRKGFGFFLASKLPTAVSIFLAFRDCAAMMKTPRVSF